MGMGMGMVWSGDPSPHLEARLTPRFFFSRTRIAYARLLLGGEPIIQAQTAVTGTNAYTDPLGNAPEVRPRNCVADLALT